MGDVLICTEQGVLNLSAMVAGKLPSAQDMVGSKFNTSLARYISGHINERYWQIGFIPQEDMVYLASPALEPEYVVDISFCMSSFNHGWATITNMPTLCFTNFNGATFAGTKDGKIYLCFDGYKDGANFDDANVGSQVTGFFQTGFYDMGSPTQNKRVQRLKLLGMCNGTPGYVAAVRSEYDIQDMIESPPPQIQGQSLWDVALWDHDLWYSRSATFKKWFGVAAFGKKLSTVVAVRGLGYTLLTDYEVTFEAGLGL
jgi:hypothetical protein